VGVVFRRNWPAGRVMRAVPCLNGMRKILDAAVKSKIIVVLILTVQCGAVRKDGRKGVLQERF